MVIIKRNKHDHNQEHSIQIILKKITLYCKGTF